MKILLTENIVVVGKMHVSEPFDLTLVFACRFETAMKTNVKSREVACFQNVKFPIDNIYISPC